MTKYRPFIQAVQWTGTNVTEIRQFVRANTGTINDAVITNGILYLQRNPTHELRPDKPIAVNVTDWAIITGDVVSVMVNTLFVQTFELDP